MKFSSMNIIEHPDFSADEAWIIFKKDAPQVPQDLRDKLSVPCILTGDVAMTKRTLTLLQAINVPSVAAAVPRAATKNRAASSPLFRA